MTTKEVDTVVDFGVIEDFYKENECTEERKSAWELSSRAWDDAIAIARKASSESVMIDSLREASRIESEWGDDPSTRQVASTLCCDYSDYTVDRDA